MVIIRWVLEFVHKKFAFRLEKEKKRAYYSTNEHVLYVLRVMHIKATTGSFSKGPSARRRPRPVHHTHLAENVQRIK